MTGTLRDLLARGAEAVERPVLDVGDLVAEAERRLVRRRVGIVAASVAAVAVVVAGGIALQPEDPRISPAPSPTRTPDPSPTEAKEPKPALGPAIYFDALAVEGDELTDAVPSINGQKDIYLTREGGTARQIIATEANEHCPTVSPGGDLLAYLEGRAVVVRRLDPTGIPGAAAAKVGFGTTEGVTCPLWSPDGRQLAVAVAGFDEGAYEQTLEVRVIDADGTARVVAEQQAQWMPLSDIAWSPDGDAIAYTTPDSVWVAPLDGGDPEMLWQGRAPGIPSGFPPYPGRPVRLWWLPTGELAFSTQTEVDGADALRIMDPDTGRVQVLGTLSADDPSTWSWSPDGSRLVYTDVDGGARVFDRATGKTVPVRPRLGGRELSIWRPAWSADGSRLVATTYGGDGSPPGSFGLVSMDPDGSSVEVLTPWNAALYSSADVSWSPR